MSQFRQQYPNHLSRQASLGADRRLIDAARNVLRTESLVRILQKRVDGYEREVLAQGNWRVRPEMQKYFGDRVVTEKREVDLLSDADRAEFERRRAQAARAAGLAAIQEQGCPLAAANDRLQTAYKEFARRLEPHTGQRVADIEKEVNGALWLESYIALNLDVVAPYVLEEDGGSAGITIH